MALNAEKESANDLLQRPVLLVVPTFSRHPEAIAQARQMLETEFGVIGMESPAYRFHHTKYYESTMGSDLIKPFFVFSQLVEEDSLPSIKHRTIAIEQQIAATKQFPEERPVNIDPGILTLGKFLLATTKDQQHRIYLGDGIFAEVTLRFQGGVFQNWPWTYADYQEKELHEFLTSAREYYRTRLYWLRSQENFAT